MHIYEEELLVKNLLAFMYDAKFLQEIVGSHSLNKSGLKTLQRFVLQIIVSHKFKNIFFLLLFYCC